MTVARRLFAIGCWVLIAMSLAHLVGHYGLLTSAGDDDTHRQLLSLMRGYTRDFGLGFVRSTFDILAGFSLAFAILPAGMGLVGLALARHGGGRSGAAPAGGNRVCRRFRHHDGGRVAVLVPGAARVPGGGVRLLPGRGDRWFLI